MWKYLAVFLVALFAAAPASAQFTPIGDIIPPNVTGINGARLSTNPTMTLNTKGYSAITVYVNLTYVAATTITMQCSAGNFATYVGRTGVATVNSSGAITMADGAWTYPTGGVSRVFRMIIGSVNDALITCQFGGAGASTDTIVVAGYGG